MNEEVTRRIPPLESFCNLQLFFGGTFFVSLHPHLGTSEETNYLYCTAGGPLPFEDNRSVQAVFGSRGDQSHRFLSGALIKSQVINVLGWPLKTSINMSSYMGSVSFSSCVVDLEAKKPTGRG